VNFDFSDDQKQLRDQMRRYLTDRCPSSAVRAILEGPEPYDRELYKGLGEMGFLGAAIPEEYGGVGLGHLELCVLAEELGRVNAPVPVDSSIFVAAEFLLAAGSEAQKQVWLPKLASGEAVGTYAQAEGAGRVTAKSIKASVSGGKLSGVKVPVADGDSADLAIVAARAGGEAVAVGADGGAEVGGQVGDGAFLAAVGHVDLLGWGGMPGCLRTRCRHRRPGVEIRKSNRVYWCDRSTR